MAHNLQDSLEFWHRCKSMDLESETTFFFFFFKGTLEAEVGLFLTMSFWNLLGRWDLEGQGPRSEKGGEGCASGEA